MINFNAPSDYPLIGKQLVQVNRVINQRINTRYPELQDALRTMASHGGKYIRPTIVLLMARIIDPSLKNERLIKVAASIEILHMASLIHDDVIDDSPKRRGAVSIQSRFGKDIAVYSGDLLFTVFFDLLTETAADRASFQRNAHAMRHVLNGELGQMAERFDIHQGLTNYLRNVNGKTATLFWLAAGEGARLAGATNRQIFCTRSFGRNIGISFQMLDDLLDYSSGDSLNKPVMEDLSTGVYSLPLLLALQHADAAKKLKPLLAKKRQLTADDMVTIQQIVKASGALQEAEQLATKFTNKALQRLHELPAGPTRKLIHELTISMLHRNK